MKESLITEIKKKLGYFNEEQLNEILKLMYSIQLNDLDAYLKILRY